MTSSLEPLPPALRSMWRLCKIGYQHEPALMGVAFGLTLVAALPEALPNPRLVDAVGRVLISPDLWLDDVPRHLAERAAHGQHVEKRLRRVLVAAVAGVDDAAVDLLR